MKTMTKAFLGALFLMATPALANDSYHVYKTSNGECEIDTRDHSKMKDQRGTDQCLGHFSNRTDAEKVRSSQVKSGSCKCPSGNNC
ncbi:hypothetical protein JGU66_04110 [Myxococcaceae bacterium JPH2]|nr:hypothetical protein [Myxococcaceae bacterium JPH2]